MTSDAPDQPEPPPAAPGSAEADTVEPLPERIVRAYPWTVANHYALTRDARLDARSRLRALLACWRAAIQLSALVLLQLYAQRPTHHPSVLRPLLDISAPNTDRWMTLALSLSKLTPHQAPNTPWWPELARAVARLPQLRHGGTMVASALKSLRSRADSSNLTESAEALNELLERHTTLLEVALEVLAPLEALTLWRRVDERTALRLQGLSSALRPEACSKGTVRQALERHPIVAAWSGFAMSMSPWMIAPSARQDEAEALLLYQGHASHTALYAGLHSWRAAPAMTRAITERLRDMTSPGGAAPTEHARHFTQRTLAGVVGTRLPAQGIRARPDIDAALLAALEPTHTASAALLLGNPGSGRCTQLCRLAQQLLNAPEGPAPLLILGGAGSLERRVVEAIGARDAQDLDEILTAWPRPQRLVILIDTPEYGSTLDEPFRELDRVALILHQANEAANAPFVKLILSANLNRWHLTKGRWREEHDTPFFTHAFALAHFPDDPPEHDPAHSPRQPFLTLPLLTEAQAAESYTWVSHAVTRPCPTPWGQLDAATHLALRSPLAARIYHMTFSGVSRPPSISDEDALWRLWCEQTLNHDAQLAQSLDAVMRPAITGHHGGQLDQDALCDARLRWAQQTRQGHPELIDASQDPGEHLSAALILRPDAASGWTLSWPALGGALALWTLRRAEQASDGELLSQWLAAPPSALRDEAVVLAAVELWRAGQPAALTSLCEPLDEAHAVLLIRALAMAAPCHGDPRLATWRAALETFLKTLDDGKQDLVRARLLWGLGPLLNADPARLTAQRQVLELCAMLTEQRLAQAPDSLRELRNLVEVYQQLASTATRTDQQAQHWLERSRVMAQRQRTQETSRLTNASARRAGQSYLRDLTNSYRALGPMLKRTMKHLDRPQQGRLSELSARYVANGGRVAGQNPSAAMTWFDKARVIDEYLLELNPDARHIMLQLAEVYRGLAQLNKRRHPDKASAWLEARLTLLSSLQQAEPDHAGHQRAMASTHNRLGELAENRNLQRARRHYTEALSIRQRLVDATNDDPVLLSDLSSAYHRMGRVERHHAPEEARAWFEKDLALCARLVSISPDNETFIRNLAFAYYHLGQSERDGDPAQAHEHFTQDVALTERLIADHPQDVELHKGLLRSYEALKSLCKDTPREAAQWTHRALNVALVVHNLHPEDQNADAHLATLYTELLDFGEVAITTLNDDTALLGERDLRLDWARALVSLRRAARERRPDDPRLLQEHAEASARLGRMLINTAPHETREAVQSEAREHLKQAISAYEALNPHPHATASWHTIVTLYQGMAELSTPDRRLEARWLQRAADAAQRGLEARPDHGALNISMVRLCDRLAQIDPRADGRWQQRALEARLTLVPLNPDPLHFERALHEALSAAPNEAESADAPSRRRWLMRTRETLEFRLADERTNPDHQRHLAICNLLLSDLDAENDVQTALKLVNKAQARLARLAGMAPDDRDAALALTWCHARGVELNAARSPRKALEHSTRRVTGLEALAEADPDNEALMALLADVSESHGELLRTLHPSRAQPWFDKALAIREQLGH